jgi:predicted  nucleic acid-binding Zn-ribbon protein
MALNEALHRLFLVDQQVRGLESRLSGARRRVKAQQGQLHQLNQQATELRDQLRRTEAHQATLENEIASADTRINHLRDQMNAVKTNKEYSAMLVEVNTLKADRSKLEDSALESMSRIEELRGELEKAEQQIAEQQRIKANADSELADREGEVQEQLDRLRSEREHAASEVPDESLLVFERLAETYEGEAMAPIIEEDRRRLEYVCGGCYMQIPVEKVNLLLTQDQMVRCSSCSRILYMEPELKDAMGR